MLPFRFLIPLALLSLVASPAHATIFAQAAVRTSLSGDFVGDGFCQDGGPGEAYADVSCSQQQNWGHGTASVQYGSLETYARLASPGPPSDNHHYQAYGWAEFSDDIMFQSSGVGAGESTSARMIFDLSGSVVLDRPSFMLGGTLTVPWTFRVMIGGLELQPSNGPISLSGEYYYDFDLPSANGSTVSFSAKLVSDVRCFSCFGSYEGEVDFMGTAGLSAVQLRDPDSGEFLDPSVFTVTSGEGASYANVVPEPGTALLLACGLVGLAVRGRQP